MKARLAVVVAFLVAAGFAQKMVDATRGDPVDVFLYAPQRNAFRYLSFGHYGLMADILHVKTNVYLKRHFASRDFRYLDELYQTMTTLDPYFQRAYHYGAIFLSSIALQPREGLILLEQGITHDEKLKRPPDHLLYMEAAAIYLIDIGDVENAVRVLKRYLDHPLATDAKIRAYFQNFVDSAAEIDPIEYGIHHWRQRIGKPLYRERATDTPYEPIDGTPETIFLQSQVTGEIREEKRVFVAAAFEPIVTKWRNLESGAVLEVSPIDGRTVRIRDPEAHSVREIPLDRLHDGYHPQGKPSGDDMLLQTARRRIRELKTKRTIRTVTERIGAFKEQAGRFPKTTELPALIGDQDPPAVAGNWHYDQETGVFQSQKLTPDPGSRGQPPGPSLPAPEGPLPGQSRRDRRPRHPGVPQDRNRPGGRRRHHQHPRLLSRPASTSLALPESLLVRPRPRPRPRPRSTWRPQQNINIIN